LLFCVGEAGPGLALDQEVVVGASDGEEDRGGVADHARRLAGFVEAGQDAMYLIVVDEGEHGAWPPTNRTASKSSTATSPRGVVVSTRPAWRGDSMKPRLIRSWAEYPLSTW